MSQPQKTGQFTQNIQNQKPILSQPVKVKDSIKIILQNDMLGMETELQSPIPTRVSTTLQQSINLTQQISNDNTIPETVKNFIRTPFHLERSIFVGLIVSLDTFTSFLMFTPIRILTYFYRLLFSNDTISHFKRIYDLLLYISMILCVFIIYQVDIGIVYHYVRAESVLKLYALYNALEMLNRLLSAFSIDIHNSLLLSIKNKKILDSILFFSLTFLITLFHSFGLFFYIMALNVAINSKGYALLTLLVSNNILEIKSTVWKRMFPENVFQILCADIVELFELFSFVVLLSLSNFGSYQWDIESNPELVVSMIYSLLSILIAEIVVDSIKHMFVGKFNKIPLSVYDKGRFVLLNDLISTKDGPFKLPSIDTTTVSARRLGMPIIPLSVLFICFGIQTIPSAHLHFVFVFSIVVILYLLKVVLTVSLRQLAFVVVAQTYYESDDLVTEMKTIGRYLMEKGRIPQ